MDHNMLEIDHYGRSSTVQPEPEPESNRRDYNTISRIRSSVHVSEPNYPCMYLFLNHDIRYARYPMLMPILTQEKGYPLSLAAYPFIQRLQSFLDYNPALLA